MKDCLVFDQAFLKHFICCISCQYLTLCLKQKKKDQNNKILRQIKLL